MPLFRSDHIYQIYLQKYPKFCFSINNLWNIKVRCCEDDYWWVYFKNVQSDKTLAMRLFIMCVIQFDKAARPLYFSYCLITYFFIMETSISIYSINSNFLDSFSVRTSRKFSYYPVCISNFLKIRVAYLNWHTSNKDSIFFENLN